jgi:hypothetical protein
MSCLIWRCRFKSPLTTKFRTVANMITLHGDRRSTAG